MISCSARYREDGPAVGLLPLEEPTVFLQGLARRIAALKGEWVKRVASPSMFDEPLKLSDFLRPDVFLNALRQQTARKLKVSIDSVHMVAGFGRSLFGDQSTAP